VAAARVCVLSMSELEMVDAAVGMGCELTIISLTPPRKLRGGTTGSLSRKKQKRSAGRPLVKMSASWSMVER